MRRLALPCLLCTLACSSAFGALTRGPFTQNVDQDSAVVGFRLDQSCAASVRFGPGGNATLQAASTGSTTDHFIHLDGLQPDTEYTYEVEACGQPAQSNGRFRTAPAAGSRSVHFATMGDMGTGGNDERDVASSMVAANPEFWLALGDNAYEAGTDNEFTTRFFAPLAGLLSQVALFPTPGNHEYVTNMAQPYLDAFDLPTNNPAGTERYYSFDWGFVHVVSLDSNCAIGLPTTNCSMQDQKAWLQQDLANSKAAWKVVIFHHPVYSSGEHGSTVKMQEFIPLFEAGGVDLVLTGHDHDYERTFPMKAGQPVPEGTQGAITYLVVGTGGATNRAFTTSAPAWSAFRNDTEKGYLDVAVEGGTLTAKLLTASGQVIDTFTLKKTLPPPAITIAAEASGNQVPINVQFTATTDPADASIHWEFGDGQTADGATVAHAFDTAGTYTVKATATSGGESAAVQTTVTANPAQGGVVVGPTTPTDPTAPVTPGGGDGTNPPDDNNPGHVGCAAGSAAQLVSPLVVIAGLLAFRLGRRRRAG